MNICLAATKDLLSKQVMQILGVMIWHVDEFNLEDSVVITVLLTCLVLPPVLFSLHTSFAQSQSIFTLTKLTGKSINIHNVKLIFVRIIMKCKVLFDTNLIRGVKRTGGSTL
jgi:hypothetical protein